MAWRDLVVTQPLFVKKHERLAIVLPQELQAFLSLPLTVAWHHRAGKRVPQAVPPAFANAGGVCVPPVRCGTGYRRLPAARAQLTRRVPATQALQHSDECFLGSILGVLAVTQHAVAETKHLSLIQLHEHHTWQAGLLRGIGAPAWAVFQQSSTPDPHTLVPRNTRWRATGFRSGRRLVSAVVKKLLQHVGRRLAQLAAAVDGRFRQFPGRLFLRPIAASCPWRPPPRSPARVESGRSHRVETDASPARRCVAPRATSSASWSHSVMSKSIKQHGGGLTWQRPSRTSGGTATGSAAFFFGFSLAAVHLAFLFGLRPSHSFLTLSFPAPSSLSLSFLSLSCFPFLASAGSLPF